ncbi:MAG TPA: hypothetical protein PLV68_18100, partial [Ilumatobacteraceae bacterium]|nr:hypothetical protein [Ilumatobacteraceae bacterium]
AGVGNEPPAVSWPLVDRRRPPAVDATTATAALPLAPFRIAAFAGSIVRGWSEYAWSNWTLIMTTIALAAYTIAIVARPIVHRNDNRSRLRVIIEAMVVTAFVLVSGGWDSPFALCLLPTAMVAGFVAGNAYSAPGRRSSRCNRSRTAARPTGWVRPRCGWR